jgi:hypothetical protein
MGILGRRNLHSIILRFTGDRWANTELAITYYEEALTVSTRDADPAAPAAIKSNLGNVLPGSDGRQSRGEQGGGNRVLSQCSERFHSRDRFRGVDKVEDEPWLGVLSADYRQSQVDH